MGLRYTTLRVSPQNEELILRLISQTNGNTGNKERRKSNADYPERMNRMERKNGTEEICSKTDKMFSNLEENEKRGSNKTDKAPREKVY
jgi:hypothetical protein